MRKIGPLWEVMLGGDETLCETKQIPPLKNRHKPHLKDCYRNLVKSGQFESKYIDILCPSNCIFPLGRTNLGTKITLLPDENDENKLEVEVDDL